MVKFGWLSPVAGHAGSDFQPIVMYQERHILPTALPHFDSVWIADHFYGFDKEKTEGFLEGWTTLTWLAAKFPDVMLCHHVLGHGYRNPALTRQDGVDAAGAVRRAVHARHRRWLARGRVPLVRLRVPVGVGAAAPARRGGRRSAG